MDRPDRNIKHSHNLAELIANDPQLAAASPDLTVIAEIEAAGADVPERINIILEKYADRPALGHRDVEFVKNDQDGRISARLLPTFSTITYRTVGTQVDQIARALAANQVKPGDRVCELGFVSQEYVVVDLALTRQGIIPVPLQKGAPADKIQQVIDETEPVMVFASMESLKDIVSVILGSPTIKQVIVFDYLGKVTDHYEAVQQFRKTVMGAVQVETFPELLARGSQLPVPPAWCITSNLAWLIYTSGSTGAPKGVINTYEQVAAIFSNKNVHAFHRSFLEEPSITINFIPMSHGFGRAIVYGTLCKGGTAYFTAKSDMSTLMEDTTLVKPTELYLVPRILDMLHQEYESRLANELAQQVPKSRAIANVSLALRQKMGNRYFMIISGGAPIAQTIIDWAETTFQCVFHDEYGITEGGGYVVADKRVLPSVAEYKLVDVPELGYFVTDKPFPRGEFLIKSTARFHGYYKRPETTAKAFDDQGFYRTGDIMAEVAPGQFVYVDRCNNVIKLAQGEFVTLGRLNVVFGDSPLVKQIYVYGDGHHAYLLAVVVPTPEAYESHSLRELKRAILQSFETIATAHKLASYEVPKDILIETVPFSLENRLLLPSLKPAMPQLRIHYKAALNRLYADRVSQRNVDLDESIGYSKHNSVLETVMHAAKIILHIEAVDLTERHRFSDLGGDSLSALSFASLLRDVYGIEIPVTVINSPASNIRSLATWIEETKSGAKICRKGTFNAVHGTEVTTVRADDLKLEKFIDIHIDNIGEKGPHDLPRNILVTGSTGFLGRFLLLELLEYAQKKEGTVFCLVRASDNFEAQQRLDQIFSTSDSSLNQQYQNLASNCKVIAGDKGEKRLGVDEGTWDNLASRVDMIVDAAAFVNHVASYDQLFAPNVAGTAELIRLALTSVIKPYVFLSSVAVGQGMPSEMFVEQNDIRAASPVRRLEKTYANGYATSKWASEVLLREAHEHYKLPVKVFRSSMILAHRECTGAINHPDMFTRLLLSLLLTQIAPSSFYESKNGNRPRTHYDGIPVDFLAASITDLSTEASSDFITYHAMNHHDDGVGLDEITDWLRDLGYSISTISDYNEWLNTFTEKLEALPQNLRQRSLLPLIFDYQKPKVPQEGATAPNTQFRTAIGQCTRLKEIPHVDLKLIKQYIAELRSSRLLDTTI